MVVFSSVAFSYASDGVDDPAVLHRWLAEGKIQQYRQVATGAGAASLDQLHYDATYYDIDLALDISTSQVTGRVYMEARSLIDGLTQFDVDLYLSMSVDSVFMGGAPVAYNHLGSEIFITPPATIDSGEGFNVTMYYHGNPASGGFGAFGFSTHGSPPQPMIWSLSEPYYARNWWPCKDTPSDKADSLDISITCRDDLFAASNGVLIAETDNGDGTKTYDWSHRHPIVTYLVSVAVTNFDQLDYMYMYNGGADSMPVHFWVYPERRTSAEASYPEILEMLDVLGTYYGPYPFLDEKYAISHFAWGGGMEHQTNTSQSSTWYSWGLNVHELAHQWWGDHVTCKTWHDIWLNEGFASWSEALYRQSKYGDAAYRSYMASMEYFGGGTVYVDDTTNVSRIFHGGLSYDKGAWVVHMLRHVLGETTFFDALAEYRVQFGNSSADTEDLKGVCEQVSGKDLGQFFDDWIMGTYFPRYIYGFFVDSTDTGFIARVRLEQFQSSSPQVFDMPVDLLFEAPGQTELVSVNNTQRVEWFDVLLSFRPDSMYFDPYKWILKYQYEGASIATAQMKDAIRDEPYDDTLQAERGQPPYYWELVNGQTLPAGLFLSAEGEITGTPGITGDYRFTVRIQDSGAPSTSMEREVGLSVGQPLRPPGDVNNDGLVTSSDILALVEFVFKSGPAPDPLSYGDVDLSCTITSADVIYLVNYVFKSGPAPFDGCA